MKAKAQSQATPHKWGLQLPPFMGYFEKKYPMQGKISVIVVDDHSLVLESIAALLQSSATIVHTSNSTDVALKICKAHQVDVAFIDARMRPISGIELIGILRKEYTSIKVVGITSFYEEATIADFIRVGVNGVLDKNQLGKSMISDCLKCILNGTSYFPENVKKIIEKIAVEKKMPSTQLSLREQEIIQLLSRGLSAKEIADSLKISKNTVEDYKKALMEKTNTKNSTELISFIHRNGLI